MKKYLLLCSILALTFSFQRASAQMGCGTSLDLNGTDAYVQMGNKLAYYTQQSGNPGIPPNLGFTWEMWFNGSDIPTDRTKDFTQTLMAFADTKTGNDIYLSFGGPFSEANTLTFAVDGPGTADNTATRVGGFQSNTWYHVAGVRDFVNNTIKIYINGVERASNTLGLAQLTDPQCTTGGTIGAFYNCEGDRRAFFKGKIDEVRIWNVVRTAAQIQADMNVRKTAAQTNLVLSYNFDEVSGNALDVSGGSNPGTLQGEATRSEEVPFDHGLRPQAPAPQSFTTCEGTPAQILIGTWPPAPGSLRYNFYDLPEGGTPLNTFPTSNWTTPVLTGNTTYFVESVNFSAPECRSAERTPFLINVNPAPVPPPTLKDIVICAGVSPKVEPDRTNGIKYNFYTQASGGTPRNSAPQDDYTYDRPVFNDITIYIESVNMTTGCKSLTRTPVSVKIDNPQIAFANDTAICTGNIAIIRPADIPNMRYYFYDASGTKLNSVASASYQTPAPLTTTTKYFIETLNTITGCISDKRKEVTVTVNQTPAAPMVIPTTICRGQKAGISPVSNNPNVRFNFYLGTNLIEGSKSYYVTEPLYETTTFLVEAIDIITGCGNSTKVPVTITVMQPPATPVVTNQIICSGTQTTIIPTPVPGVLFNFYPISAGPGEPPLNSKPTDRFTTPILKARTLYSVEAVYTDPTVYCLNEMRATVIIDLQPVIKVELPLSMTGCLDSTITLNAKVSGGTGKFSYSWSPATGLDNAASMNPALTIKTSGTFMYYLTVKDETSGCTRLDSIKVTTRKPAQIALSQNTLDFGTLDDCTTSKDLMFEIENSGTERVAIDSTNSSPSSFRVVSPAMPFTIEPGTKKSVTVRFTATNAGVTNANILFYGKPCNAEFVLPAKAEKLKLLVQSEPVYNFGKSFSCDNPVRDTVITITNSGSDVVKFDMAGATVQAPFTIASPSGIQEVKAGGTLQVTIQYNPLVNGSFAQDLKIPFRAGECATSDTLKVSLSSTYIIPTISSTISNVGFEPLLGCEISRDTTIYLTNESLEAIQVTSVNGPLFTALSALPLIQPGETEPLRVRFTPQSNGAFNGNLEVNFTPCEKTHTITFTGSKQGIAFSIPDSVNLGTFPACAQDIVVKEFSISNTSDGNTDAHIVSAEVTGPFTTNISSNTILPNQSPKTFTVSFTPNPNFPDKVTGYLLLKLDPCEIADTVWLSIQRESVGFTGSPTTVDFGLVSSGQAPVEQAVFTNTGATPVTITGVNQLPAPFAFAGALPDFPVTVGPNAELRFDIRLTATAAGAYTARLDLQATEPCSFTSSVAIIAEVEDLPSLAQTSIGLPGGIEGEPGDIVVFPLRLNSATNITAENTATFSATVSFNKTLLEPLDGMDCVFEGDICKLTVAGSRTPGNDVLKELRFRVLLGNAESTPIEMSGFQWNDNTVGVTPVSGEFKLKNTCVGTTRLYDADGVNFLFAAKPNPVVEDATLTYQVGGEVETVRLIVTDAFGRTVKTVLNSRLTKGRYETVFSTNDMPSGSYFYTLTIGHEAFSRQLLIVH
jgi:hypothetical protein